MNWFYEKDGGLMVGGVPWGYACTICRHEASMCALAERKWTTTLFTTGVWPHSVMPYPPDCVRFNELPKDLQAVALEEML